MIRAERLPPLVPALAILAAAVRLWMLLATGSTAEDFLITLRYAENLATGRGFAYNPGEPVLGTTTPLYALFLAAAAALGLNPVAVGKGACILADSASVWLVWRLARAAGLPGAGLVAGALLAVSPPGITWAISGMETSLVTAAGLAALALRAEGRLPGMAAALAVLVLLRIDGLLLAAVLFAHCAWRRERLGPAIAVFLLPTALWAAYAAWRFGSPVPASAVAKMTVYPWMARQRLPNLAPFAAQMARTPLHWALLAGAIPGIALVLAAPRRLSPHAARLLPAAAWTLLHYASMALSKAFLFGWYYVPPSPAYFLLAAAGWGAILRGGRAPDPGGPEPGGKCWTAAALAAAALGLARMPAVQADLARAQAMEDHLRRPIGEALRALVKPGERVMLEPIGYIGYYSRVRVLDAVGLVSPEVLPFYRAGVASPYLEIMAALMPEWVLLRAGEYADVQAAPVSDTLRLERSYRLVRTFADPAAPPGSPPAVLLFHRRAPGDDLPATPHRPVAKVQWMDPGSRSVR